jgi:GT2 family glycosyltransferase
VNDGSNDQTSDVLKPYYQAVDYFETNQVGKAAAVNIGLEHVNGDYVWIFDDDDVAFPEALERFVSPLESSPQYGFSHSTFLYTGTRLEDNRIGNILGEFKIPDLQKQGFLIPLLEANFLCGAVLFARTACYVRVGKFDPSLIRSEDYDMAIRISRQFSGVLVPGGPTFHYRQHEGLRGSTSDRFKAKYRRIKWLEYDQNIFRKLYRELPLKDYLPPGYRLDEHLRQAHLQRLTVMAGKLLIPEVLNCLENIAALNEATSYSSQEREILNQLINRRPLSQTASFYDNLEIFSKIHELTFSSPAIRRFRSETIRAIMSNLGYWKQRFGLRSWYGAILRIKRLYF